MSPAKAGLTQSKDAMELRAAPSSTTTANGPHLDLFVANYIDFDIKNSHRCPRAAGCAYKGIQVACGPPGNCKAARISSTTNNGDGTFTDVSQKIWDE